MGLRETLNRNPALTTGATVAVILLTLLLIISRMRSGTGAPVKLTAYSAYFTTDDGETTFPDLMVRVAPFDREGAQAVRVHMYSCDGGKTRYPGYLEKISEPGIKQLDKARGPDGEIDDNLKHDVWQSFAVVKPAKNPGARWVGVNTEAGAKIRNVACPHNDPGHTPTEYFHKN